MYITTPEVLHILAYITLFATLGFLMASSVIMASRLHKAEEKIARLLAADINRTWRRIP